MKQLLIYSALLIVCVIITMPTDVFATTTLTPTIQPSLSPALPASGQTISTSLLTTPTISDSDIRNSLQDRLKKAAEEEGEAASKVLGASQKKALVGTLKDLTNNTLTVQVKHGGTKLAGITQETTFIRKGKTVKQSDLVIGDFLIVMGYMNGNNLLDAKRVIVVDSPVERPVRKIAIGTVANVSAKKKSFDLTVDRPAELGGPETLTITPSKKVNLDFSQLSPNVRLVIIGIPDEKSPTTLTLTAYKLL